MRFFSLPTKILLLTLALMLVLIVLVTSLSLQRLGDSFTEQQTLKRQQVEQHFTQYQLLLQNQQQSWFESFAELTGLQQQSGFTVFTEALQQRYDVLSLYLNIEALWVFTGDNPQANFASNPFPTELASMVAQTRQEQRPQSRVYCAEHCSNVVSLPVSDQDGKIAVLVSSQTLADVVIALGQALQSEVAIVRLDAGAMTILSATGNLPELKQLELASWKNSNGAQFSLADVPYFIYHIPLVQQQQQHFAILLLENIRSYQAANNAFKWQLVVLATLCFLLFAWLTNLLTRRLTSRLLLICNALPMLAENKYRAFRDALPKSAGAMSDEVDQLYDAGQTLSRTLEQLQDDINTQTRELENMAMYDRLTGLANRNMLQYQLKKSIAALTDSSALLGLLFLDMDQFKRVNDIRGHEQGDQLLIEASNRLRASLDKTDIICRFGGDEFIVVTEVVDLDTLGELATRLIAAFRQPMLLGDEEYQLNISIGISSTRNAQLKPDDLVRQADLAMYQAKGKGGNSLHFYSQQMFDDFQNRLALESDLKLALAQQQFALHLQPKINLVDRKLQGLEVLLRWHSPARGMVPPDEFIAVLEYAHLMIPVGYWVIEQSFHIMVQLQTAGFTDATIAINLSAAQLNDAKLPAFLDRLLQQHKLSAALFELELTESMLANNINETINSMQHLKSRGFRLAIDDFGTGYSSLSYLRQMPVDTIKIDKSFVFGMLDNQADFDIITSTIAMVRKLGLEVVAEGVETQAQCKTLTQHQCDIGQGYLFSRPIPSDMLIEQLQANMHDNGQWR